MALRRPSKRRRASITSLIDVIFLLLLFFMLSSTFTRFSEVEMVASGTGGVASSSDEAVDRLTVGTDGFVLNSVQLTDADVASTLAELTQDGPAVLAVTAEEAVTTQRFVDALALIAANPGLDIRLVEPPT